MVKSLLESAVMTWTTNVVASHQKTCTATPYPKPQLQGQWEQAH